MTVRNDDAAILGRVGIIGKSPEFVRVVEDIRRLAAVDVPVLLQGETGTGKELVARAIHYLGRRCHGPFVPVDGGALPVTLFERELFGHVRGAFTDARRDAEGLIAQAELGTLFFDEVHTIDRHSQAALLRFMQDLSYRPLGGTALRRANARIVVASNRRLEDGVAAGWFREDLFYRLSVATIDLPPLRDRRTDIPLLAASFLDRLCAHYHCERRRFDSAYLSWLAEQPWRGNIRELENFVHREFLKNDAPVLFRDGKNGGPCAMPAAATGTFNVARSLAVSQFETGYLRALLAATRGNVSEAARRAGKERRVFGRLMKKHNIGRSEFTGPLGSDTR